MASTSGPRLVEGRQIRPGSDLQCKRSARPRSHNDLAQNITKGFHQGPNQGEDQERIATGCNYILIEKLIMISVYNAYPIGRHNMSQS